MHSTKIQSKEHTPVAFLSITKAVQLINGRGTIASLQKAAWRAKIAAEGALKLPAQKPGHRRKQPGEHAGKPVQEV